ncbi:MAG TPA: FAD-binding oxidoreductase [Thermoleophilaceae bacterium]|nr:FAD-binding oxidoreductase [Thermoleophilaceae bacterium]
MPILSQDKQIGSHTATGWWLEEAGRVEARGSLEGIRDADVVVIGGGYTGMWAAWHLLAAGARVALLEAGICGHGPSGRNGGFCESMWMSAPALRGAFGDRPARALLEASSETVGEIGAWCDEHGVDAWFDQSGYLCVSTAPAFDGVGRRAAEAAAALGAPHRVVELSADEVRARCASPVFRAGVLIPDFATVQPARLAVGLRRRLVERGALLFERSHVRSLCGMAGGVVAETVDGKVRASSGVLAVGPAARRLPALRPRLTVTSSHIVLTEPVPDVIAELGWTGGECITDGRTLIHYFRTTRDGRIVFGWGGGRLAYGSRMNGRVELDAGVVAAVRRHALRIFPGLAGRRITHAWGGPIDVSPRHIPQLGSLPGAPVHFAVGYTGNGVGPSHLAGRILASLALDRRDELTRLPIVEAGAGAWVPPEPFAWLGGSLVRTALIRREHLEEQDRRPDPVTRAICGAPAAVGMHLAR